MYERAEKKLKWFGHIDGMTKKNKEKLETKEEMDGWSER